MLAQPILQQEQSQKAVRPRLSICIVNWNTCDLLEDCLASVYDDPASQDWEVVVVDNASSDDSVAMVRRLFPQVRLLQSRENLGFSRANNLAIQQSRAPYLLLLNSDTRLERGALGRLLSFMEEHPEAGMAGPMLVDEEGSLQLSCGIEPSLWTEVTNKLLLHKLFPFFKLGRWDHGEIRSVGWISGACMLVRRAAVEEVGLLDPEIYMFYEDLEWCLRIRKGGWKILYYPFSQVAHLGGQSTRKNLKEMLVVSQRSLFYLFEKHFSRGQLFILRILTILEMVLRSVSWLCLYALSPARRRQGRQRLGAYGEILYKSLTQSSYWSPGSVVEKGR